LLSEYHTELGQHRGLYRAYEKLANSEIFSSYSTAQKTVVENALRDFRLSGIDLSGDNQQRFKQINKQLSELSATFSDNVLDATQHWKKHVNDEAILAGLPPSTLALAQQSAQQANKTGWLLSLDFPLYFPVMTYANNRELRKEIYAAYVTRASELGPDSGKWDNSDLMRQILALRHEKAQLLGFENYAEYSLATKMADSCDQVLDFLKDLAKRSRPLAEEELNTVQQFARQLDNIEPLEPWDITYYNEKLRQEKYDITQEELKPFFPEQQVLQGMFAVANKLYGITIEQQHDFDSWHEDVKLFVISDTDAHIRGKFFLDLYARPKKRGGAWMDDCVCRRKVDDKIQLPVAFLVCNFSPPVGDEPALFTHQEVTTLFHEFGHGLQHMLTQIDHLDVSGINGVAWDAVELPSQFMENWCWDKQALSMIARHYQTNEGLPAEMFDKMLAAKNFQCGMMMLRQLEFSLFDFRMHHEFDPHNGQTIQEILDNVRESVAVVQAADYNRFQHSFSHIFAGGYAAGYFSYKWAEVLSADAFSSFEETDIFDHDTGQSFLHHILEKGGSQKAMDLFVAFRGRPPKINALLRHNGIQADTT